MSVDLASFKGELVHQFKGLCPAGSVSAFRDGVAFTGKGFINCIPLNGVPLKLDISTYPRLINSIAWVGEKLVFASSSRPFIYVWDPESGETMTLRGHEYANAYGNTHGVLFLMAMDDTSFLSGATDNTARVWTLCGEPRHFVHNFACHHKSRVTIAAMLRKGMFATGAWGNVIKVWGAEGNLLHDLATTKVEGDGVRGLVRGLAALGEDRLVSGCSWDTAFQVWSCTTGDLLSAIQVQKVGCVATLSTGLVVFTDITHRRGHAFITEFTVIDPGMRVVKKFKIQDDNHMLIPLSNGRLAIRLDYFINDGVYVWE